MKHILSAAVAAVLTLTGCSTTPPVATVKDSDVEQGIKNSYNNDPGLQAAKIGVDADVKGQEIKLSGEVPTEALRTRAVAIATTSYPQMRITDKIDVKPVELTRDHYTEDMAKEYRAKLKGTGSKIGNSLDDAWIHTKITAKLATDKDTPATKIDVDVDNQMVTLRGNVPTLAAKSEAERIAKETDGVKKVTNRLTVHSR
ncbi:MAG: BON domain-containing protein [Acidobacteriota bacterium]